MLVKCLSVRQPHATAILTGAKLEEFRSRPISYRGTLAIHASRTLDVAAFAGYPNLHPGRVRVGAVLGLVDVIGCEEDVYGGYAWILSNPRWLKRPLELAGRVGLFAAEIPEELLPLSL